MVSERVNMSNQINTASSSISSNFIQRIKLERSNYLVRRAQVLTSIIANGLRGFINGNSVCPAGYLTESTGELNRLGRDKKSRVHHLDED